MLLNDEYIEELVNYLDLISLNIDKCFQLSK